MEQGPLESESEDSRGVDIGPSSTRWTFGDAVVCTAERALWIADRRVKIDRSAFDVLLTLVVAQGALVSRAELLRAAWPGRVVTENSVSKAISRIRTVLDDPDGQLVVSDHGFGYRIGRPVRLVPAKSASGGAPGFADIGVAVADAGRTISAVPTSRLLHILPITAWRIVLGWFVLIAMTLAVGGWAWQRPDQDPTREDADHASGRATPPSALVIAVMPFDHTGVAPEFEVIAKGLSLQLAENLSRIHRVRVVSPTSNDGSPLDPRVIGKEFGADAVLQGELLGNGDRLRVALQLNRCTDSALLWSRQFDRRVVDAFATEDDIAQAVLDALRIELLPEKVRGMARRPTTSPEAYEEFLLAQHLFKDDETGGRRALAAYKRAVALDPGFTDAWLQIADLLGHNAFYSNSPEEALAGKRRALEIVEEQLLIHPQHVGLLQTRAAFLFSHWWRWDEAMAELQGVARIAGTDHLMFLLDSSRVYAALGDIDRGIAFASRAAEVSQNPAAFSLAGYEALGSGRIDEAQVWIRQAIEIDPLDEHAHYYLGLSELMQGRPAQALEHFDDSAHVLRLTGRAAALHTMDQPEPSEAELQTLIVRYAHVDAFRVAQVYAWRGQGDRAFEWLERARGQHEASMMYLKYDPLLAGLRSDPRYRLLLKSVNLDPDNAQSAHAEGASTATHR